MNLRVVMAIFPQNSIFLDTLYLPKVDGEGDQGDSDKLPEGDGRQKGWREGDQKYHGID